METDWNLMTLELKIYNFLRQIEKECKIRTKVKLKTRKEAKEVICEAEYLYFRLGSNC